MSPDVVKHKVAALVIIPKYIIEFVEQFYSHRPYAFLSSSKNHVLKRLKMSIGDT